MPGAGPTSIAEARTRRTLKRVVDLMQQLSPADLETLQHDLLSRPPGTVLPSSMMGCFRDWLKDSYNPIERESQMAPENQGETELRFLVETDEEGDDIEMAAKAAHIIKHGFMKPYAATHDRPEPIALPSDAQGFSG